MCVLAESGVKVHYGGWKHSNGLKECHEGKWLSWAALNARRCYSFLYRQISYSHTRNLLYNWLLYSLSECLWYPTFRRKWCRSTWGRENIVAISCPKKHMFSCENLFNCLETLCKVIHSWMSFLVKYIHDFPPHHATFRDEGTHKSFCSSVNVIFFP